MDVDSRRSTGWSTDRRIRPLYIPKLLLCVPGHVSVLIFGSYACALRPMTPYCRRGTPCVSVLLRLCGMPSGCCLRRGRNNPNRWSRGRLCGPVYVAIPNLFSENTGLAARTPRWKILQAHAGPIRATLRNKELRHGQCHRSIRLRR